MVYASLDDLPLRPTYDVIMSNHVLEHVRDVCGTLERLRQWLKPGGRIVLKLPIDDAALHISAPGRGRIRIITSRRGHRACLPTCCLRPVSRLMNAV